MTEQEWLTSEDSEVPFRLADQTSSRKWRLFAIACCYRVRLKFYQQGWNLVELAESLVEGRVSALQVAEQLEFTAIVDAWFIDTHAGFDAARCEGWDRLSDLDGRPTKPPPTINDHYCGWDAERAAKRCASLLIDSSLTVDGGGTDEPAYIAEREAQLSLARDIFGNPFRPFVFSPAWRTDTAVSLARGMYDAREFSAMPIMADALQDAGCDSDDILDHCRDPKAAHVRGCWVVDLVLGKV